MHHSETALGFLHGAMSDGGEISFTSFPVRVAFQHNSQWSFERRQDFHHFLESKKKKCECSKICKYFNYKNVFLF